MKLKDKISALGKGYGGSISHQLDRLHLGEIALDIKKAGVWTNEDFYSVELGQFWLSGVFSIR